MCAADPLLDQLPPPPPDDNYAQLSDNATNNLAQALCDYRYNGRNKANPKKLVMKNGVINDYRLKEEYRQIVDNGPNSIRWAIANGKLNMMVMDARLVAEVSLRPELPAKVKKCVLEKLKEMAKRIIEEDDSDDDE